MIGPSNKILDKNGLAAIEPFTFFLLPSRVFTSTIAEILPPYSALKPPVITSTFLIISVSKTENKPME